MGHPRMKAVDNIQRMLLYNASLKFKGREMMGKTNIGPTSVCPVFFSFSSSINKIGTELARIFPRL